MFPIISAMKASAQNQNVRRENKLYSYADQMAELELRKVRQNFGIYNFSFVLSILLEQF